MIRIINEDVSKRLQKITKNEFIDMLSSNKSVLIGGGDYSHWSEQDIINIVNKISNVRNKKYCTVRSANFDSIKFSDKSELDISLENKVEYFKYTNNYGFEFVLQKTNKNYIVYAIIPD